MSRFTESSPTCPSQTVRWNKFVLPPLKTLRCMTFKLLYKKVGLNIDKTARNPFCIVGIFVMNSPSSTALSLKARRSLFLNHSDQRCWTRSIQVILELKKTLNRAREILFWPQMATEIQKKSCLLPHLHPYQKFKSP